MFKGLQTLERVKRESWGRVNALKIGRADRKCEICEDYFYNVRSLYGHHLVSLRNGGKDEDSNTIIVCRKCVLMLHAFEALERAEDIFKIDVCFMSNWGLIKFSLHNLIAGVKSKLWQRQS